MSERLRTLDGAWRSSLAVAAILVPSVVFEKYTFYLYTVADPNFFNYSGSRIWFDIIWFATAGILSTFIVGRKSKASVLPPLVASALFVIMIYAQPFCSVKECYVSSTDGLAPLRDFLLFGSLGVITSASTLKKWHDYESKWVDSTFQISVVTLVGFALSFFPITHIFAGVSVQHPLNYLQWFLAGAPAGIACSMLILGRGNLRSDLIRILSGISGVFLALIISLSLPCGDCSGYPLTASSIMLLALLFSVPAVLLGKMSAKKNEKIPAIKRYQRISTAISTVAIVFAIVLLVSFYFVSNYEASVVNGFSGVTSSSFSPLEVGRTFVYSAGYLSIPRVTSKAVGVNVSFGNTTIPSNFPNNFLSAGIGDQSPNCCKDGLDLTYRADVIQFSNGTEALVARAWWACDTNMACGGYSWQQLLHFGIVDLPTGTLSNWVNLQMNWTGSGQVEWFYRISYSNNHSSSQWSEYSDFIPPAIQNHYWDAGLFYVGAGNLPTGYAYFCQFGVASGYPIKDGSWHVYLQCPEIFLNGSWSCLPSAAFISGAHSFWKVIYTFGSDYSSTNFSYLGNHEVEFFYSGGESPKDGTPIW